MLDLARHLGGTNDIRERRLWIGLHGVVLPGANFMTARRSLLQTGVTTVSMDHCVINEEYRCGGRLDGTSPPPVTTT